MSKFKVYEFNFDGLWLGGTILIISTSREQAMIHAKKKVLDEKYNPDSVQFVSEHEISEGAVAYFYDGNY